MLVFTAEQLRTLGHRIFAAAGAPDDVAAHVAFSLVESNLAGHDSHGIIRIPTYVLSVQRGDFVPDARPTVLRESATTAVVSGRWGFGQLAATFAADLAIAKVRASHLAAVGVVECNHIGRLGEYVDRIASAGLIGVVTAGGFPGGAAAPFGGAGRALGTNPFAFGVPAGERPPMIVDFATTVVAEGKLQVLRAKKQPAPLGWILDKDGNPTTNVEDFYSGGSLVAFGGHKGYALGMVAEVLAGSLPGVEKYRGQRRGHGTFVLAIDPDVFRPIEEFGASVDAFFGRVKDVPTAPGFDEVLIPGEPERRSRAQRLAEGIPVAEDTWARLQSLAEELGISIV